MQRHKQGESREQIGFELLSLEDLIDEENPVRAIDAVVNRMDTEALGFVHSQTKDIGRKSYDPSDLLKLYLYGYYNGIRSSRKLERECGRNIELMWLLGRLKPDFKTIANFRKDNKQAHEKVFYRFSVICDELGLLGKEIVAIDGSKFRASNNSNAFFTKKRIVAKRQEYTEAAQKYIALLDVCDKEEDVRKTKGYSRKELEQRLDWIDHKLQQLDAVEPLLGEHTSVSTTDPDAKLMKHLNGAREVSHNVQIAVDEKAHIVASVDVTSDEVDYQQFYPVSVQAKEALDVGKLTVLADRGYFSAEQIESAENAGIIPIVSKPDRGGAPSPEYGYDYFLYEEDKDVYVCPQGKELPRKQKHNANSVEVYYGSKKLCADCPVRDLCTKSVDGRTIMRGQHQKAGDNALRRVYENRALYKKRKNLVEHVFGTIKADFGFRYLQVRRTEMVRTEMYLCFLAYNLKRAINTVGIHGILTVV